MRLALFQPEIAQNVGAAIRNAACFSATIDIIEPCGFPLTAKELRRVAMDYADLAPPRRHAGWDDFETDLRNRPARLILLTTKADQSLWEASFSESDVFILGRESSGAPDMVHERADLRLRLPIAPTARSLNMAVAGALALAEARRQLGWPSPPSDL